MRCRRCNYTLESLPPGPCPECGASFDPADPRTYEPAPRPVRTATKLLFIPALWPLPVTIWLHIVWAVAYLKLGHRPTTMDKSYTIPIAGDLMVFQYLLMLAFPISVGAILILANRMAVTVSTRRQKRMGCLTLALCWGVCGAILYWDPLYAWTWFWD